MIKFVQRQALGMVAMAATTTAAASPLAMAQGD